MKPRSNGRAFADLCSPEVHDAVEAQTLVWPVGSIEQHGPHLPLSVDLVIAEAFAQQIARELAAFALPVQPVAARSLPQSGGGLAFPGTVFVRGGTLIDFLADTIRSLCALPVRRLLIVNGHFENEPFVFEALDQIACERAGHEPELIALSWWSLVDDGWLRARLPAFPGWHAEHGGLTETSLMLYLRPDLVTASRPCHDDPPRPGIYLHPADTASTTNNGVLSSTTGANAELGEELFWHVVGNAMALVTGGHGLLRPSPAERTRP
ncbi:creatininase family protein [Lentzea sp. CA-135723]|uniref:creatininase family protein n=1 Tax=Lentzea sp. CA-135723 TaxID=3239950 RepID=UPI003D905C5C